MTGRRNWLPLILLIVAGEGIFFLPFVLARIFRPTVLATFEITNLQLGTCFSVYGVVAFISYFFGGVLADRVESKNLIALGLLSTGFGGIILSFFPSLYTMFFVYGFWGFTTIFLFWSPLIKATRLWGGDHFQGRAFGGLESGRGLAAAILGLLSVLYFSKEVNQTDLSYINLLLWVSFAVIAMGVIVWFLLPADESGERREENIASEFLQTVLRNRDLWILGGTIICAYVGYKITDVYSLYANEVLGMDELQSAQVGSGALWLRPVYALIAGILVDRFPGVRIMYMGFLITAISALVIANGGISSYHAAFSLIILGISLAGVYGIRSIYFSVFEYVSVPKAATGTAVGVVSLVGYTPDIFMSPLMGLILDNYPGELGHQLVFGTLSVFAVIGSLLCQLLMWRKWI